MLFSQHIRIAFSSIFVFDPTSLSKLIPVHDRIISQVIVALCCSTRQLSDLKREKSKPIGSVLWLSSNPLSNKGIIWAASSKYKSKRTGNLCDFRVHVI